MTAPLMLKVDRLNSFYNQAHILHDVSLRVQKGELLALLGRNGAGKSTTLKSIIGLVKIASGLIEFQGLRIEGKKPFLISRLGLGYVPEERRIFTGLTVMENLETGRQPPRPGIPVWTPQRLFELFPNLGRMRDRPGGQMSGGEQQMLSIARTLMGNPELLLLDEPSEGLAPVIVEEMAKTIEALKKEGVTVILSEQNLHFAMRIADRVSIIEKGSIRFSGDSGDLQHNEAIKSQYLMV